MLTAAWLQEGAEEEDAAAGTSGSNGGEKVIAAMDENNLAEATQREEEEAAKEVEAKKKLTLKEVSRMKEGAAAFKAYLEAKKGAAAPGKVDAAVKAKVRPAELSDLRVKQFRAYKAIRKLDGFNVNDSDDYDLIVPKAQGIVEKFVRPLPWMGLPATRRKAPAALPLAASSKKSSGAGREHGGQEDV